MDFTRPLVIKLVYEDDIRRWHRESESNCNRGVQFTEVEGSVSSLFRVQKFKLKFVDDEGDRVTIASQADLDYAVELVGILGRKSLKIFVEKTKGRKCKRFNKCHQAKSSSDSNHKCVCGVDLKPCFPGSLYNGRGVYCDGCNRSCGKDEVVYHCPTGHSVKHPNGYDLCKRCYRKTEKLDIPVLDRPLQFDAFVFPFDNKELKKGLEKAKEVQRRSLQQLAERARAMEEKYAAQKKAKEQEQEQEQKKQQEEEEPQPEAEAQVEIVQVELKPQLEPEIKVEPQSEPELESEVKVEPEPEPEPEPTEVEEEQQAKEEAPFLFQDQLDLLFAMGYQDQQLLKQLLLSHSGDLQRVFDKL